MLIFYVLRLCRWLCRNFHNVVNETMPMCVCSGGMKRERGSHAETFIFSFVKTDRLFSSLLTPSFDMFDVSLGWEMERPTVHRFISPLLPITLSSLSFPSPPSTLCSPDCAVNISKWKWHIKSAASARARVSLFRYSMPTHVCCSISCKWKIESGS